MLVNSSGHLEGLMKTNEIINEAGWKDNLKKAGNFAIKVGDAAMGTSGTTGFDVNRGNASSIVGKLTTVFFPKWVAAVQTLFNRDGGDVEEDSIRYELQDLLTDVFDRKINPDRYVLQRPINNLVNATLAEVNDENGTMREDKTTKKAVYQLMTGVAIILQDTNSVEKNARMVIVHKASVEYYFSFRGAISEYALYKQDPADKNKFNKVRDIYDNHILQMIRDKTDDDVIRKTVYVEDLTDGKRETIIVRGE